MMGIFGRNVGLKALSIGLAVLLWLAVTGDPAPRMVPVVPLVAGRPADGFRLGTVSAEPPTVEVIGPADALELITAVVTEPIPVDGATAPFTALVEVVTESSVVELSTPVRARVVIDVVPAE